MRCLGLSASDASPPPSSSLAGCQGNRGGVVPSRCVGMLVTRLAIEVFCRCLLVATYAVSS
jgi:hypothetical protein